MARPVIKNRVLREFDTPSYDNTEVEFVCVNEEFPDATPEKKQYALCKALERVDGVHVYRQDDGEYNELDYKLISMMVIILDKDREMELRSKIERLAEKYGVEIDMVASRSHRWVEDSKRLSCDNISIVRWED